MLFVADYILYASSVLQPFRLLRPWLLLCRDRELRRVHQAIVGMYPVLLRMVLLLGAFLLLFAALAVHIFPNDYNATTTYDPTQDEIDYTGMCDNVLVAMMYLFVLITTQNYPTIMMPVHTVPPSCNLSRPIGSRGPHGCSLAASS